MLPGRGVAGRFRLVDNSAWIEWYISLALDSSDAPRISYFAVGAHTSQLKYAEWVAGAWRRQVLDEAVWLGEFNSLALDSTGAPHISYLDVTHSQLKYARRRGAAWEITVLETVQWWGGFTSIAVDSQDRPHITYGGSPVGLRYARWHGRRVGRSRRCPAAAGSPRWRWIPPISPTWSTTIRRGTAWPTRGATRRAGACQTVDRLADVGSFNSLALDAAGRARGRLLRGGPWRPALCAAAGGAVAGRDRRRRGAATWANTRPSLCNPAGACWISYYDATNGDLKLAYRQAAGPWQIETVDSGDAGGTADVGRYTALALDAGGRPVDQLLRRDERRPQAGPAGPPADGRSKPWTAAPARRWPRQRCGPAYGHRFA